MDRFIRTSRLRRIGMASIALLLAASVTWASTQESGLPAGDCDVAALMLGSGSVELLSGGGEEWIDLSIDLTPGGEVEVNGIPIGTYCTQSCIAVEVSIRSGLADITIRNVSSGGAHCSTTGLQTVANKVRASGNVASLDVH